MSNFPVFVFEGIDHVGKSTLVAELSHRLEEINVPYSTYSFPGKESRTLGSLVYDIHHNQDVYFDMSIDQLSLQMLHVAAHIDTITTRIVPDLKQGKIVLLDRFWWSTYAYGVANGIKKSLINDIVLPEKKALKKLLIAQYFFIKRKDQTDDYSSGYSELVLNQYKKLCSDVEKKGLLTTVDNDFDLASVVNIYLKKNIKLFKR